VREVKPLGGYSIIIKKATHLAFLVFRVILLILMKLRACLLKVILNPLTFLLTIPIIFFIIFNNFIYKLAVLRIIILTKYFFLSKFKIFIVRYKI
jgi:hypothetical protein